MPATLANDPLSVLAAWITAFNAKDLDLICGLYSAEAILWGTFSPRLIRTQEGLRDYFLSAFAPELQATIELRGFQLQFLHSVSIISGEYVLDVFLDGSRRSLPARFTIVLARADDSWLIVNHHSSVTPSQRSAQEASRSGGT